MTEEIYSDLENDHPGLRTLCEMANAKRAMISVWFSVPGAIVSGELCSAEAYAEIFWQRMPLFLSTPLHERQMSVQSAAAELRQNRKTIYLLDVTIIGGHRTIGVSHAQVAIDAISAWGMGRYEPNLSPDAVTLRVAQSAREPLPQETHS